MIDDALRSSRTQRRERALRDARQRLERLEIEAHRIGAELARLESENEDEIADELTLGLRSDGIPAFEPAAPQSLPQRTRAPRIEFSTHQPTAPEAAAPSIVLLDTKPRKRVAKRRRANSPAWILSLGMHAAVLAVLAPMTYVVLTNERLPLFASMFDVESPPTEESGAAPIELVNYEEAVQPDAPLKDAAKLSESFSDELAPLEAEPGGQVASSLGQLNTLPTDVGTLMAGGGSGPSEKLGGGGRGAAGKDARLGTTSFFGTRAQANRVVFVVDNSSSMKDGRLETALVQLNLSIEAMSPRQSFYVIFVSDQTYPMFYPEPAPELLPATGPNKQRLREWLGRVILAGGKNRELIKAMEMAAELQPQTVYLLWDGDLRYNDRVRQDVLNHLARPNQWRFTIHTFGMGINSLDSTYNLTAIAQAHGGIYREVTVAAATQRKQP